MTPIERLFSATKMRCVRCNSDTGCSCWERCSCGWLAESGKQCRNPATIRCSTKIKYGKWNPRTRRYEPTEAK